MIELVIDARRRPLGGFEVGRVLPFARRRMVGPFIFFDHMGPVDFPAGIAEDVDVRPHPHIGLSTLTYLFEGEIMHRDSVGSEQPIVPGEVNWMTAGRGITHSERFERARREGGHMDGIQAWIALPTEDEECDPAFDHIGSDGLPKLDEDGVEGVLIAGQAWGLNSAVPTRSPLFYIHWTLPAGSRVALPPGYPERAVYIASGEVEIDGQRFDAGRMPVFAAGADAVVTARAPSVLMAIGGDPIGPRFIDWNFVSSRKERIEQAKADWRAQRMKLPDLDSGEFIPLPPERDAPANPMS
ncbi:MAG: pirin family protein [Burkholderiaceae bacterium]